MVWPVNSGLVAVLLLLMGQHPGAEQQLWMCGRFYQGATHTQEVQHLLSEGQRVACVAWACGPVAAQGGNIGRRGSCSHARQQPRRCLFLVGCDVMCSFGGIWGAVVAGGAASRVEESVLVRLLSKGIGATQPSSC